MYQVGTHLMQIAKPTTLENIKSGNWMKYKILRQCCGSGSVSGSGLDPDSMGPWIRIRIRNSDSDPGGQK
jgi:hypothetical protein